MRARSVLRDFTGLKRVRACGALPIGNAVVFRKSGPCAGLAGLSTCGSTWACPQCSSKIAEHRRQDLNGLLLAHRARGGSAMFLTLTMRHRSGQSLTELWDALSLAWRRVQGHRVWREYVRPELTGTSRVVEVTHGRHGWHVHLHVLLFVASGRDLPVLREQWEPLLVERWASALSTLGHSSVPDAQRLQLLSGDPSETLADYFAKATYEVARADLKDARYGNRTPFALLRDLVEAVVSSGGDLDDEVVRRDLILWREWEQASRGRRQWGFSRGLRDELAPHVPELTDDQVVEVDVEGTDVLAVSNSVWSATLRRDPALICRSLEVVESSPTLALARLALGELLARSGIDYEVPAPRAEGWVTSPAVHAA